MRSILGTFRTLLTLLLFVFVLSACGGGGSGGQSVTIESAEDISLAIAPDNLDLALNQSATVKAIATLVTHGATADVSGKANWSSENISIASITRSGNTVTVVPQSQGSTTITAELDGISATATVTIGNPLIKIVTDPPSASINDGSLAEITATGTFNDGSIRDITEDVTWISSTETVATVDRGIVSALEPGDVTISAVAGPVSGNTQVTIAAAPDAPGRMEIGITPNAILEDEAVGASVSATVFANDEDNGILSSTNVLFAEQTGSVTFTQDEITIDNDNPRAETEAKSTLVGKYIISAVVPDTTARAQGTLNVVSSFSEVVIIDSFTAEILTKEETLSDIEAGSKFTAVILNTSNRSFNLLRAELVNGQNVLDTADLSGTTLGEGDSTKVDAVLDDSIQDEGVRLVFHLSDPVTTRQFTVDKQFTSP
ncbi:Ig-like domain-containing protein [Marinobacter pelagius]|uniref:Ig-like domain (Group 2) n=1 Tax=Marinobacter pelagius TaxID=379482 RepID=A0A1I4QBA5_9GAMM|nr:Ig-like domain-containing protein [Marinobacter pelagius]SFM37372.1 Ig-like domain (group 2) [Marinobacter pelagius]